VLKIPSWGIGFCSLLEIVSLQCMSNISISNEFMKVCESETGAEDSCLRNRVLFSIRDS
jgi:hypothetical protein